MKKNTFNFIHLVYQQRTACKVLLEAKYKSGYSRFSKKNSWEESSHIHVHKHVPGLVKFHYVNQS